MRQAYTNPARIQQQARMQATRRSEEARRKVQAKLLREQDRMNQASEDRTCGAGTGPDHSTKDN